MAKKRKAVVVTDTHRGVYFGYLVSTTEGGNAVRLEGARMAFRWGVHKGHEGVFGLASGGPSDDSNISPRVNMKVRDVSKVIDATPEAVERWEAATW